MNKPIKLVLGWLAGGMALLASAGWALGTPEEAAQALRAQAQRLWDAQAQGDWSTVYDLLAPADRGDDSREQFVAKRKDNKWPLRYESVRLGEVAVADQVGWVEVSYNVQLTLLPNRPPEAIHEWQVWVNEDGWRPVISDREQYPLPPAQRSAADEAALARRAEEHWQASVAQDWPRVYQLMEPAYRERMPQEDYVRELPVHVQILAYRVAWVEAIGDQGRVKVVYTGKVNDPSMSKLDPQEKTYIERWVKVNGEWYLPYGRRGQQSGDQRPVE